MHVFDHTSHLNCDLYTAYPYWLLNFIRLWRMGNLRPNNTKPRRSSSETSSHPRVCHLVRRSLAPRQRALNNIHFYDEDILERSFEDTLPQTTAVNDDCCCCSINEPNFVFFPHWLHGLVRLKRCIWRSRKHLQAIWVDGPCVRMYIECRSDRWK